MPNNKMERFTQRARRVLSLAQEEAERLHHNNIGPEHLLLGIMLEEHGIGARVLRDLELEQRRVKELIEELTLANVRPQLATTELSDGSKKILELSVDEARRMGHHYIGTEHLLLGLARMTDSVALDVLKRLGVSPEEIRRQTRRMLQESPAQVQPNLGTQLDASPAAVPMLEQATKRLPADAYEMLENVLMKILDMIEADKLSVEKGVELFSTLTPDLKLAPGQQAELISHLFDQKKFNDYNVHLTTLDAKGTQTFNHSGLPLTTVLTEIDR
ncbi:MAG: Clp protease N-terminal domain-containing protein, partial [Chloroflexota bacterium]